MTVDHRRATVLRTLMPGFTGHVLPTWVNELLADGLGGVCLFGTNIANAHQVRELTSAIYAVQPSALIATDEEGGDVTRLYYDVGSPFPGNAVLGRLNRLDWTAQTAKAVGGSLRDVGINMTFAPDADVNVDPRNPVIGVRSFGTNPALVGKHVAAWTRGVQQAGVIATAKHFPGHGDTAQDSHLAMPEVTVDRETLDARELVPFRSAIAAETRAIMTSHILVHALDESHPATMSSAILNDLLRGELGFTGLIVSDALDMKGASGEIGIPEAAVRALAAGADLLCIGTDNSATEIEAIVARILEAIDGGELSEERLSDAAARVLAAVGGSGADAASGGVANGGVVASASTALDTDMNTPTHVDTNTNTNTNTNTDIHAEVEVEVGESGAVGTAANVSGATAAAAVHADADTDAAEPETASIRESIERLKATLVGPIIQTFSTSAQAVAWRKREGEPVRWVKFATTANIAVGEVPWGPFAAGIEPNVKVTSDPIEPTYLEALLHSWHGERIALVGQNLLRYESAAAIIAVLRRELGDRLLVVDMGWSDPQDPESNVDVATFGASQLVGEALIRWAGVAA